MRALRGVGSFVAALVGSCALFRGTVALADLGGWTRFVVALASTCVLVGLAMALGYHEADDGLGTLHGPRRGSRGRCGR